MAEATQIEAAVLARAGAPGFIRRALAIVVGALFVYAGAIKLVQPVAFASDIANYHIVPWAVAVRVALYLPWLELLCGLALIFHRLFDGAVRITAVLMLIFIAASVSARARGINVSCGCFGSASGKLSFAWHLALDLVLLAILIALWFWPRPANR